MSLYFQIMTGYKIACDIYDGFRPKVLIDFSSRILRTDKVLDFIKECSSNQEARKKLKFKSVVSVYENYAMWQIHDIDFSKNPSYEFEPGKTLFEYYTKKYNLTIRDKDQPLLVNKNRRTGKISYLLPEFMMMTGLSEEMKNNPEVMRKVAELTKPDPDKRMAIITEIQDPLATYMKEEYSIGIEKFSIIEAIQLETSGLKLFDQTIVIKESKVPLRAKLYKPATFDNWVLLYHISMEKDAEKLIEDLKKASLAYGITVKDPYKAPVNGKNVEDFITAAEKAVSSRTQIILTYITKRLEKHYEPLKKVFNRLGLASQFLLKDSINRNALSLCSKVLIQMNAKIGLEPWIVTPCQGLPERTMIIGANVYHNINEQAQSCVGLVSTLNSTFSHYFSQISKQDTGQELMISVGELVKNAAIEYAKENNNKLPECIVFYRDGVGVGQFKTVVELEVASILDNLASLHKDYKPQFIEIIVMKKVNDRFFKEKNPFEQEKGYVNPDKGTVIYQDVVGTRFDFCLISQDMLPGTGTCTPTKYSVIYNNSKLTADAVYQLTYDQCFNYYNWSGSIKVPAPVQYANRLAYLMGQVVNGDQNPVLAKKLFYL